MCMAIMCVVSLATNEAYMQHDPYSQSSCPTIFLFMLCAVSPSCSALMSSLLMQSFLFMLLFLGYAVKKFVSE